ncbi:uncharacterized protein [Clytia hemisphaerica]|uniref:uncharacterized protein n=1 Tax=Clytia hemisphaerica TaxID=252671 RepID=UPI0034D71CC4
MDFGAKLFIFIAVTYTVVLQVVLCAAEVHHSQNQSLASIPVFKEIEQLNRGWNGLFEKRNQITYNTLTGSQPLHQTNADKRTSKADQKLNESIQTLINTRLMRAQHAMNHSMDRMVDKLLMKNAIKLVKRARPSRPLNPLSRNSNKITVGSKTTSKQAVKRIHKSRPIATSVEKNPSAITKNNGKTRPRAYKIHDYIISKHTKASRHLHKSPKGMIGVRKKKNVIHKRFLGHDMVTNHNNQRLESIEPLVIDIKQQIYSDLAKRNQTLDDDLLGINEEIKSYDPTGNVIRDKLLGMSREQMFATTAKDNFDISSKGGKNQVAYFIGNLASNDGASTGLPGPENKRFSDSSFSKIQRPFDATTRNFVYNKRDPFEKRGLNQNQIALPDVAMFPLFLPGTAQDLKLDHGPQSSIDKSATGERTGLGIGMQDFSYHHDLDAPFFGNRAHKEILKVENPFYQDGGQSQKETFKVDANGFSLQSEGIPSHTDSTKQVSEESIFGHITSNNEEAGKKDIIFKRTPDEPFKLSSNGSKRMLSKKDQAESDEIYETRNKLKELEKENEKLKKKVQEMSKSVAPSNHHL